MVINKSLKKIIWLGVLVVGITAGVILSKNDQNINESAAPATKLSFSPTSQEVGFGSGFTEQIVMDSGENKVTGIDIQLTYDSNKIHINEVKPTTGISNFNTVIKNEIDNSAGKLRYTAFTFDRNLAVSGNLNILTLSGNVVANNVGSYEISFKPETVIIAVDEGDNVLTNTQSATIKVVEGEPNFCGGTCGSNNNCQPNFFCYEGFCRNPVCASDTDCSCTITAAPTARPATSRPTSRPVTTITSTQRPSPSPTIIAKGGVETLPPSLDYTPDYPDIEREPDTSITTEDLKNQVWPNFIKYTIGALLIAIAFGIGLAMWIKKNRTRHILPPTNI